MLVVPPVNTISSSTHVTETNPNKNELFPKCLRTKQVAYPFSNLKSSHSVLDYHELKRLQGISDGSGHREEAHQMFMHQFAAVFKPPPRRTWTSRGKNIRPDALEPLLNQTIDIPSPFLSQPIPNFSKRSRKSIAPLQRDIQILRRHLRKLHVQRTSTEHDEIFRILKQFPQFMALDHRLDVLRQLVEVAHLELCEEVKQPVLPYTGFFLVLKGGVTSSIPSPSPASSTTALTASQSFSEGFSVGQCFGTALGPSDDKPKSSWLITTEENCEFLKINKDEVATIKTKFEQNEYQEKYSLIRSCGEYKLWSKQPTDEIVRLIEWLDYPANTILASEGFRCPFIAFVKTGECHILRKVDVVKTAQNGTKSRQIRQVVMGKIVAPDSFGEISVLLQEAMTCTIVTATACRLGIVRPDKSANLPEVTRKLLLHTAQRTFANVSQDEIRKEYVNQETRKEWTDFKKDIIQDVMFKKNIRSGQGKWQHALPTATSDRLTKSSLH